MSNEIYISKLRKQDLNTQRPANRVYLVDLYSRIVDQFDSNSLLLEIGSGAGTSRHFMQNLNVIRTDILPWDEGEVVGAIDATKLPYPDDYFDGAFAIDVLHHLEYPIQVLSELRRVIKPSGRIVLIEPHVSLVSYLIFKIFHDEMTSLRIKFDPDQPAVGAAPSEGNQTLAQTIFRTKRGLRALREAGLLERENLEMDFFHHFSFFATGGLTRTLPTPPILIRCLLKIERLFPDFLSCYLSARGRYVLTVIK